MSRTVYHCDKPGCPCGGDPEAHIAGPQPPEHYVVAGEVWAMQPPRRAELPRVATIEEWEPGVNEVAVRVEDRYTFVVGVGPVRVEKHGVLLTEPKAAWRALVLAHAALLEGAE
jgi:hypothetical protein